MTETDSATPISSFEAKEQGSKRLWRLTLSAHNLLLESIDGGESSRLTRAQVRPGRASWFGNPVRVQMGDRTIRLKVTGPQLERLWVWLGPIPMEKSEAASAATSYMIWAGIYAFYVFRGLSGETGGTADLNVSVPLLLIFVGLSVWLHLKKSHKALNLAFVVMSSITVALFIQRLFLDPSENRVAGLVRPAILLWLSWDAWRALRRVEAVRKQAGIADVFD